MGGVGMVDEMMLFLWNRQGNSPLGSQGVCIEVAQRGAGQHSPVSVEVPVPLTTQKLCRQGGWSWQVGSNLAQV